MQSRLLSRHRAAWPFLLTGIFLGSEFAARAGVLLSITGDVSAWTSANGQAIGWFAPVQTADLTISVLLDNRASTPSDATAYLTTIIGPGASAASEIAQTTITLPASYQGWVSLFDVPVLAAGSYWLSFSAPTGDIDWAYADPAAIAGADGIDYIGYAEAGRPEATYLPASAFYIDPDSSGYEIEVIANSEPPSALLTLGSISGLTTLVLLRRRKRNLAHARLAAETAVASVPRSATEIAPRHSRGQVAAG
ncbi:MAG: hypothetical protein ABSH56_24670 [Bryobacteraceae bacterium]|jgi:hypothetical protein